MTSVVEATGLLAVTSPKSDQVAAFRSSLYWTRYVLPFSALQVMTMSPSPFTVVERTWTSGGGVSGITLAPRGVGEGMKYVLGAPSGQRPSLTSLVCAANVTESTSDPFGANRPMVSPVLSSLKLAWRSVEFVFWFVSLSAQTSRNPRAAICLPAGIGQRAVVLVRLCVRV